MSGVAELGSSSIGAADQTAAVEYPRLAPHLWWRVLRVLFDLATVFSAASLAYFSYLWLEVGKQHFEPELYLKLSVFLAVVTVFALQVAGAYRSEPGLLRIEDVRHVLRAATSGILLLLVISFLLRLPEFSRITAVMFWPVITFALIFQRVIFWEFQKRSGFFRRASRPVVIYGAGETGRLLARSLGEESHIGLVPMGFVDDDESLRNTSVKVGGTGPTARLPVFGGEADLDTALGRTGARTVLVAMPSASTRRIEQLVASLERRGIRCFFVPSAGDMMFSALQFGQLAGMPVLTRRRPVQDRFYAVLRRTIDVIVSGIALLLALPIIALSATLVKLTSPGRVFFTQERVGLAGRRFKIYKIRTMHQAAPRYALHPQESRDRRIFPVGRWLRRLSFDELPQLWNVLKGEMSLVGPRPEMAFIVDRYNEVQRQRLSVTPGITGLWQISADRASAIHENMQYDLYYVENRSLSLDIAILLMTPFVLFSRGRAR